MGRVHGTSAGAHHPHCSKLEPTCLSKPITPEGAITPGPVPWGPAQFSSAWVVVMRCSGLGFGRPAGMYIPPSPV